MSKNKLYTPDESGYLSQDATKSYYSRIGFFCCLLCAIPFAVWLIAEIIIKKWYPTLLDDELTSMIVNYSLSLVSIYCIATPIAFLAIKPLPKMRPYKESLSHKHFFFALCVCFCFVDLGNTISQVLLDLVSKITGSVPTNPLTASSSDTEIIIGGICVCIVVPLLEELVFRRLLCNRLLPLGEKKAIIISALIFGFIHGNLYQFAYAFLIGLVFGYIYVKTGEVIYTFILHCIINFYGSTLVELISRELPTEQWLTELFPDGTITFEAVEELQDLLMPYVNGFMLYAVYILIGSALVITGSVVVFTLLFRRKIHLEQGLLQTPREHRIANFFLNNGIAAAVGCIAFTFLLSIFV